MICGLLGRKLGHSYSPAIHSQLGSYEYRLFQQEPEHLHDFLRSGVYTGLNVTMPYKKAVIPYLDSLSQQAQVLGAVNTILRLPDGRLWGHNTDYFGFQYMLERSGLSVSGKKVLVLGSGGASATAQSVLKSAGAQVVVISRSGEHSYGNWTLHQDAACIVNTTPVGMYPDTGIAPIDLDGFPQLDGVLDVVYNPARTQLLLDAQKRGLTAVGGLSMLVAQAWEASQYFTGLRLSQDLIPQILEKLRMQMENIILIGMPGSGKTTVGKLVAAKLGRPFADVDALIQEKTHRSIPEFFELYGEATFRQLETEILSDLGKQSGLVIACGGGVVTLEENYPLLHQNGRMFWIQRELYSLATEGRPLSQGDLLALYRRRLPLYQHFADAKIENNGTPEAAAEKIITGWEEPS